MKNQILKLLLILISFKNFGQDTIVKKPTHTQIFCLSPISKKIDKVNGMVLGLGHVENKNIQNQTINGLNVEVNPAPIAGALIGAFALPMVLQQLVSNKKDTTNVHDFVIKSMVSNLKLKINGINISSGCFFTQTNMNGFNISIGNKFENFNGLSITPLGTIANNFNGLSIGIVNMNNNLKGLSLGIYNQTYNSKGMQFGLINLIEKNHGIQVGIFNRSYSRGLQLGIWNKNSKRSFPILNW